MIFNSTIGIPDTYIYIYFPPIRRIPIKIMFIGILSKSEVRDSYCIKLVYRRLPLFFLPPPPPPPEWWLCCGCESCERPPARDFSCGIIVPKCRRMLSLVGKSLLYGVPSSFFNWTRMRPRWMSSYKHNRVIISSSLDGFRTVTLLGSREYNLFSMPTRKLNAASTSRISLYVGFSTQRSLRIFRPSWRDFLLFK